MSPDAESLAIALLFEQSRNQLGDEHTRYEQQYQAFKAYEKRKKSGLSKEAPVVQPSEQFSIVSLSNKISLKILRDFVGLSVEEQQKLLRRTLILAKNCWDRNQIDAFFAIATAVNMLLQANLSGTLLLNMPSALSQQVNLCQTLTSASTVQTQKNILTGARKELPFFIISGDLIRAQGTPKEPAARNAFKHYSIPTHSIPQVDEDVLSNLNLSLASLDPKKSALDYTDAALHVFRKTAPLSSATAILSHTTTLADLHLNTLNEGTFTGREAAEMMLQALSGNKSQEATAIKNRLYGLLGSISITADPPTDSLLIHIQSKSTHKIRFYPDQEDPTMLLITATKNGDQQLKPYTAFEQSVATMKQAFGISNSVEDVIKRLGIFDKNRKLFKISKEKLPQLLAELAQTRGLGQETRKSLAQEYQHFFQGNQTKHSKQGPISTSIEPDLPQKRDPLIYHHTPATTSTGTSPMPIPTAGHTPKTRRKNR